MSYLPQYKIGDCTQCPAKNTRCRKRGKILICLNCIRGIDTTTQITKAINRQRQELTSNPPKTKSRFDTLTRKEKQGVRGNVKSQVRALGGGEMNRSQLLARADKVFGDWIKMRDQDANGFITCPCSGIRYHIDAVDDNGEKIVQTLHYIQRNCYGLRFDADNAHAGSSYSNLSMHLHKGGEAELNYRKYLVGKIGETGVLEMEAQKRKFHKLDTAILKSVIEHYQ